jgi:hypothetical protein
MLSLFIRILFCVGVYSIICVMFDLGIRPLLVALLHKLKKTTPTELDFEEERTKKKKILASRIDLGIFFTFALIISDCLQQSGYRLPLGIVAAISFYYYGEYRGRKDRELIEEHNRAFCRSLRQTSPEMAQILVNKLGFGDDE